MSSSSSAAAVVPKICFNSHCKEPLLDPPPTRRKGWRLRSGEIAELCDRCSSTYEQGNFCETYHSGDGGWRNCETCGKRVHCGCIVSVSAYVFLDAGGVDCVACARKSVVMGPNPILSSPMLISQQVPERREFPAKSWKPVNGPFFGQWRAPHMWNMSSAQSDLQQRLSYEFDRPNSIEKPSPGGRYSILTHEKKFENLSERPTTSSLNNVVRERYANGKVGVDATSVFGTYRGEGSTDVVRDSPHLVGENDSTSTRRTMNTEHCPNSSSGVNLEAHPITSLPSSALKDDPSPLGIASSFQSSNGSKEPQRFPANQSQCQAGTLSKQFYPQSVMDSELQAQMRNGKPRDNRARSQSTLLPRYWPRITDQELQQISGDSNSVITPLFEKMLSASDAGRIGRLVLPKKCAEAYFPTISQPEGLPLKVQDASGKDWVFQFRFWPNNNSRMYVLEGVTPCIQAMQLQAGDTVTFSRIDPEGKLIMGFRKASSASTEQDSHSLKSGNGFSTHPEGEGKGTAKDFKGNTDPRNIISAAEQRNCSKFANEGVLQKDGFGARSPQGTTRRKGSNLGSKSKRLRIENEDSMELKLTWEEAQQLLRPPPNCAPSVVLVEGHEFEEYEEAPVLGKRTYFTTNQAGENYQWAQCEDCLKWRRLPVDALLPSRWTCLNNTWDPERALCSAAQELSSEQLAELIPGKAAGTSKRSKVKVETDNIEVSDGLDTLANLAILGEGENLPPPSQPTTRHPRHRPGCTCIVCIQPPSGKGPKHKPTCTCNVCLTVKRRFRTLMLRREKRQSEKEAESSKKLQRQQPNSSPEKTQAGTEPSNNPGVNNSPQKAMVNEEGTSDEGLERKRASPSPLKAQIDLNIQPEREEEPSPKSDTGNMMRLVLDAAT